MNNMNQLDFSALSEITTGTAQEHGFELRSPFCERHGSWEIVFHKADGGLHRFVTLALSPRYTAHELRWLVELYALAQDERYSQREQNASFLIDGSEFQSWTQRETFREIFRNVLHAAMDLNPVDWRRDVVFAPRPEIASAGAIG